MGGFGTGPRTQGSFAPAFSTSAQGNGYPMLDKSSIDQFIDQHSVAIKYWKATQCPCMTSETGQPQINCNQCRGLGWSYADKEVDIKFQRAQVSGRSSQKNQGKGGRRISGTASFTFKSGIIPGDGDLVQVCAERQIVNNEYHVVGQILTDGSTEEAFRYRDIVCVESVLVFDPRTNQNFPVDSSEFLFNEKGRKINFLNPQKFPNGTKYAVRYVAVPEYILRGDTAQPFMRVSHDDGLPEPQRIRKDILYPYNVEGTRLDRAIIARQRGKSDFSDKSTFNNKSGRGPFI